MSRSSSRDVNVPLLRTAVSADARSRSRPSDSRPASRSRHARHSTANSIASLNLEPEDLINPGGGAPISEADVGLLQELVHPHHHIEATLVEEEEEPQSADETEEFDHEWRQRLPWWKRPSPVWFLSYVPFAAIAMTISAAAKIELFNYLACQAHKPVMSPDQGGELVSVLARQLVSTFDEPSQKICAQDPVVQAVVAKLTMTMTMSMGILSCMTTAWWGAMSDRFGRTRVLGSAVVGVLVMDFSFLATFWFYKYIPGGYWFLLVGPVVEGLLGGQALISATIHAYISDCTPPAHRSAIFSLNLGLLFVGVGIGPFLGSLLIRFTGNFILVFYISAAIHSVYALLVWLIIPESLSKTEMQEARARHKAANEEYRAAHAHGGILVFFKRLFAFLAPLNLFLPSDLQGGGKPTKGKRRDWNLLLVVLAYAFAVSLMGIYLYIIQFLESSYEWSTEQVGYWFSALGATRAIFLTLILPTILKFVKPKATIQLPTEANEPLTSPTEPSFPTQSTATRSPAPRSPSTRHSPKFDIGLARVSLLIEGAVYLLIVSSTSGTMFAVCTTLGAFAMGFAPAIQSVALSLYNQQGGRDSGKLFGAMSVVQALCSQVLGPFAYGLTYAKTLDTYPKTIFIMGSGTVFTSFSLLMLVRLPKDAPTVSTDLDVEEQEQLLFNATPHNEREDTLVDSEPPLIILNGDTRGRKVVKP